MPFGVLQGDLTKLAVDAIVNAANSSLLGGGGVDGAVHRAAGPELLAACRPLHGCEPGGAKITKGFRLPARYIIHAVGPVWYGGDEGEDDLLAAAYRNSIGLVVRRRLTSVAFPAISTGIYGFPLERATQLAVATVRASVASASRRVDVTFVAFDAPTAALYADTLGL